MQNKTNIIKRIVDVGMIVLLFLLMAYQVTGEAAHEWIGMGMTCLVIIHQILNRKWYKSLFKGKYNPTRFVMTTVIILLIASFILTAFCGMSMSSHAVPFLYGIAPVFFARRMHLSMSHWSFVLMGLHLGLHIKTIFVRYKITAKIKIIILVPITVTAIFGFWLFVKSNMVDYLFFRIPFAMIDYEKAVWKVFCENVAMLVSWTFLGILVMEAIQLKRGR